MSTTSSQQSSKQKVEEVELMLTEASAILGQAVRFMWSHKKLVIVVVGAFVIYERKTNWSICRKIFTKENVDWFVGEMKADAEASLKRLEKLISDFKNDVERAVSSAYARKEWLSFVTLVKQAANECHSVHENDRHSFLQCGKGKDQLVEIRDTVVGNALTNEGIRRREKLLLRVEELLHEANRTGKHKLQSAMTATLSRLKGNPSFIEAQFFPANNSQVQVRTKVYFLWFTILDTVMEFERGDWHIHLLDKEREAWVPVV